jgi:hypothetical protein
MNATPAFVWQPRTPVPDGYMGPHMVVLNHTHEAPSLTTRNDNWCDLCQADDKRQQRYGVMPLQCIAPPESQRVDQVPCIQNTAPGQCVPIAPHGSTTQVCNNVAYVLNHHAPGMPVSVVLPQHTFGGAGFFDMFSRKPKTVMLDGKRYSRL